MLFGQDCADEADQRVAVGEDADDIGAPADFLVEPFLGVVRPDLAPDLLGERGERQQVRAGVFEVLCDFGELVGQRVDDPIILCSNRLRIGLVEDGTIFGSSDVSVGGLGTVARRTPLSP